MAVPISKDVVEQITANLVDFGYEGLTQDEVQAEVDKISRVDYVDNIIGKFVHGMLVKNGYIKE